MFMTLGTDMVPETIWHTQDLSRMKQQEPRLHQFIFQQLTNIQNLAILLVLTIHELKIQHAQQWKKHGKIAEKRRLCYCDKFRDER